MNYTDDELLDILRAFADREGRPPTSMEANDPAINLPTQTTFANHFGSWNGALEAAGFDLHERRYSDEELLDALRAFADREGRSPTGADVGADETLPSESTFRYRFGSWAGALAAADLPTISASAPDGAGET